MAKYLLLKHYRGAPAPINVATTSLRPVAAMVACGLPFVVVYLVYNAALTEQRLIVNATGPATLRLEPALIVTESEIDDAVSRLAQLME